MYWLSKVNNMNLVVVRVEILGRVYGWKDLEVGGFFLGIRKLFL